MITVEGKGMSYLFAHFTGEQKDGEQIYFSKSEDGLHFTDLNDGKPVLFSRIGEKGVRDPFIVKNEKTGTYYLIATDLRIEAGKGWGAAQFEGSRDIIVWESDDLKNWSEERAVTVGVNDAGCVWAPESVYVPEEDRFFVFWASMVPFDGTDARKQIIYGAYTKDFKEFTEPFKYLEADNHLIDMTIVHDGEYFYRFVKDETVKAVQLDRVKTLTGSVPEKIESEVLDSFLGVEGPECYRLPDGKWCLIVDQFMKGLGYIPLICDDLSSGKFRICDSSEYDFGKTKKRHGGVISGVTLK